MKTWFQTNSSTFFRLTTESDISAKGLTKLSNCGLTPLTVPPECNVQDVGLYCLTGRTTPPSLMIDTCQTDQPLQQDLIGSITTICMDTDHPTLAWTMLGLLMASYVAMVVFACRAPIKACITTTADALQNLGNSTIGAPNKQDYDPIHSATVTP